MSVLIALHCSLSGMQRSRPAHRRGRKKDNDSSGVAIFEPVGPGGAAQNLREDVGKRSGGIKREVELRRGQHQKEDTRQATGAPDQGVPHHAESPA